ncbi:MAG TPA: DUF2971 domain-containing protein [Ignavibacteria bacterium]|nr:DUF2971 domain-containing protein [Ignavibacteria bacterium]
MEIYKYCPDYDKFTFSNLENSIIHFTPVGNLNDPFDGFIYSKYIGTKSDIEKFLRNRMHITNLSTIESILENLQPVGFGLYNAKAAEYHFGELENFCVSSFTREHKNILMWSHYANYHKGICLKFESYEDKKNNGFWFNESVTPVEIEMFNNFSPLYRVKYSQNISVYNGIIDGSYQTFQFAITKAINWQYEHEYRLIQKLDTYGKLNFEINKEHLKAVYLGLKSNENVKMKIIEVLKQNYQQKGYNVELYQAKRVVGKFEIDFDSLNY